jgi:hypothetical protein
VYFTGKNIGWTGYSGEKPRASRADDGGFSWEERRVILVPDRSWGRCVDIFHHHFVWTDEENTDEQGFYYFHPSLFAIFIFVTREEEDR